MSKKLDRFIEVTYYSEEVNSLVSEIKSYNEELLRELSLKKNIKIDEFERYKEKNKKTNLVVIKTRFVQTLYDTRSEKCKAIYEIKY